MAMELIEVDDAAARLDELVDRVRAGDEIYITRNGAPLVKLVVPRMDAVLEIVEVER